jgi:hypothetical protein
METQLEWMKAFVQSHQTHPIAPALTTALDNDRPVQAFTRVARVDADLHEQWVAARLNHVGAVVADWMATNAVSLVPWEPGPSSGSRTEFTPAAPDSDLERLRQAVHAAVDEMPRSELLRLSIPVQYLTGKGL